MGMNGLMKVWLGCLTAALALIGLLAGRCAQAETTVATPELIFGQQAAAEVTVSNTPPSIPTLLHRRQAIQPNRPAPGRSPTLIEAVKPMTITVVYDNNAYDRRLQTAWGFACLVERGDIKLLFDTGGDGGVLVSNMGTLGFDPVDLDVVLLSHIHGDHTGGLGTLLATGSRPRVFLPSSFPADYKAQIRVQTKLVEVDQAVEIIEGVYTTGEMGSNIIEQALVLKTTEGLVVITGCAHPGIVEMVRQAKAVGGDEPYLVVGGFHLGGASKAQIKEIISSFRRLGVQNVAPCHCTGNQAIDLFHQAFGDSFIHSGAGKVLVFDAQDWGE
jgi:7,8-dihydropterin-6-yl-methyl-4-(beta-D-ribofuranosyl)aminobenzene 5'-phosphate synthase